METSFVYLNPDKTGHTLIDQGVQTLEDLFPYALLFNQKLFSISVSDRRNAPKFPDFTITKLANEKYKIIKVAVC